MQIPLGGMWAALVLAIVMMAIETPALQPIAGSVTASVGPITVDAVPVPLNPQDPSATAIGEFSYAGGLMLRSHQTNLMHELSDIVITGTDRFASVGDGGVLLDARFVLDQSGRLTGVADATLTRLVGQDGKPLTGLNADAEGLTILPSGDRLISFEHHSRIWLYPTDGGLPRAVPSPRAAFPPNGGMEALTALPDVAADAYAVGGEDSGQTWTCRVSTACVTGPVIDKPKEFGLVSMHRMPGGITAYLLRAYDPARRNRIILKILRDTTLLARMDIAPPLTVDNFEGVTSVAGANGTRRFYLISDDNNRATQRTLLFAFDWQPR